MATAPRPGTTPNGSKPKRTGVKLVLRGVTYIMDQTTLGPRDARLYRKATGMALREAMNQEHFDVDSICALWWLARVRDGETTLTLEAAEDQFPTYVEMQAEVSIFALEADETDEDPDSPEASGGPSEPTGLPSPASTESAPGTSNA